MNQIKFKTFNLIYGKRVSLACREKPRENVELYPGLNFIKPGYVNKLYGVLKKAYVIA